jgi:hypothetical protein
MHWLLALALLALATPARADVETNGFWATAPDGSGWCPKISKADECCYHLADDTGPHPPPPILAIETLKVRVEINPDITGGDSHGVASVFACTGPDQLECAKDTSKAVVLKGDDVNRVELAAFAILVSPACTENLCRISACGR